MQYIKTISSKGQITLPEAVRERLRVKPGDFVTLSVRRELLRVEKWPKRGQFTVPAQHPREAPGHEPKHEPKWT